MKETRIIKKYQNRCLYDTSQSKYISLGDLRTFVSAEIPFVVQEAKSGKDITRQVLLQIIAEEENAGTPLFTTEVLQRFIRMYGATSQNAFRNYLDQMSDIFDRQARQFLEQLEGAPRNNPMNAWAEMARQNLETWQETQNRFLDAAGLRPFTRKDQD